MIRDTGYGMRRNLDKGKSYSLFIYYHKLNTFLLGVSNTMQVDLFCNGLTDSSEASN